MDILSNLLYILTLCLNNRLQFFYIIKIKRISMLKRVLITGGNKGIGVKVVQRFLEDNYEVVVVARDFSNFPYKDNNKVTTIEYDLSEY